MRILLDCRPLLYAGLGGERSRLILSIVSALARDGSAEWLLLVDHTYRSGRFPGFPDLPFVTMRSLPGRSGWRLWYDWQIPRLVRKEKPDVLLLTGGVAAGSVPVPQCLWMPVKADPAEMKSGEEPPLYGSRLRNSVQHAKVVFCYSRRDQSWLAGPGRDGDERFIVVQPWPSSTVAELSAGEKEKVKADYAEGKEFFFCRRRLSW